MTRATLLLILTFTLVQAGSAVTALASIAIDARMSGTWGDPAHDGEGFVLHVLADNQALVYWFTYDEAGAQRWFYSLGRIENEAAVFESLLQASGGVFGEDFDPDTVNFIEAGELSITWTDCGSATANYTVNGVTGSQALNRVSALAGLECDAANPVAASMSGTWGETTRNGEGLVIEQLGTGNAIVYWFSFDTQGNQAWFYGVGPQDGSRILVEEMIVTRGGRFGDGFNPAQVQYESWGRIEVELECDYGKFDYASTLAGYGDGKQTLLRVASAENRDCQAPKAPNILLVIADDLGKDTLSAYGISNNPAHTPTLDRLAAEGLVFDNAWSSPTCSPTRAGILTGKLGTRTGVLQAGDALPASEQSLQSHLRQYLPGKYSDAVIGKWHLAPQPGGLDHPASLGISHFAGIIGGGVENYENWLLVTDGEPRVESDYTTSKLADLAADWIAAQDQPWFLWLAFNAPHTPFHLPPATLHTQNLPGTAADIEANPQPYYLAAIEAIDTELGWLLDSLDEADRENTLVIFLGDNGTPREVVQSPYTRGKAKGTLYQGGINVPLILSGAGVTRTGERESGLVHTTDLFSTIAAVAGINRDRLHDSVSFLPLLEGTATPGRYYQFSEQSGDDGEEWAISDGRYKLIEDTHGAQQLFDLFTDPYESQDLLQHGNAPENVAADLQFLASEIRAGQSL